MPPDCDVRTPMAMHRILVAMIIAVLAVCGTAIASSSAPSCTFQSQPGLEHIGTGVDLTSFIPRQGSSADLKHFVVDLSCKGGKKWTNPYSNQSFAIYDQVESIQGDPSSTREGDFFKFDNTFEFSEHFEESVSSGGLFGLFSASEEFSETFSLGVKVNASFFHEYGKVNSFVAMLRSDVVISEEYLSAIGNLEFDWFLPTHWSKVESFIQQFGTHYMYKAALGGDFRYTSVCESVYVHTAGDAHASAQAQADFAFLLSLNGGASGSASASDTLYQTACHRSITCIGGDQALCNTNTTASWPNYVKSVDGTPGPGLTRAWYLFTPDLVASWHPKKIVAQEATVAYIAWVGLEKLFMFYEAARAFINTIAAMELPKCYYNAMNIMPDGFYWCVPHGAVPSVCSSDWYHNPDYNDCHTGPGQGCVKYGPTGDPIAAVKNAKSWAAYLLNKTALHHTDMQAVLASKSASAKVDSWLKRTVDWLGSFKELTEMVYSMPSAYSCAGAYTLYPDSECLSTAPACTGSVVLPSRLTGAPPAMTGTPPVAFV